jgi:hypothetical protein
LLRHSHEYGKDKEEEEQGKEAHVMITQILPSLLWGRESQEWGPTVERIGRSVEGWEQSLRRRP